MITGNEGVCSSIIITVLYRMYFQLSVGIHTLFVVNCNCHFALSLSICILLHNVIKVTPVQSQLSEVLISRQTPGLPDKMAYRTRFLLTLWILVAYVRAIYSRSLYHVDQGGNPELLFAVHT